MNINFSWGLYNSGGLIQFSADLNTDVEYYKELKNVLKIKRVKNYPKIRVGAQQHDGGYIMIYDFIPDGVAYSFGICNDVSWDTNMAQYGYDIYMYDHTIDQLPQHNNHFHFFKEGIAGTDMENQPLKTLQYYVNLNNHQDKKNMILKMDVEGAEYEFLETVDSELLKQFDQIAFEFHNLVRPSSADKAVRLLKKLNSTHQLVHLHGNNSGYLLKIGNTIFPDVVEALYVNKEKYETVDDKFLSLPTPLDTACDMGRPDVNLGMWNTPLEV